MTGDASIREAKELLRESRENVCPSCCHAIDPEMCWCGTPVKMHSPYHDGHNPVPMGCTCGYADQTGMT